MLSVNLAEAKSLTFLSGFWISGKTAQKGLMSSRNLTVKRRRRKKKRHDIRYGDNRSENKSTERAKY